MDKIIIDGRFLLLAIIVFLGLLMIIIETLNIWLENLDHRKARAWDDGKAKRNFLDFLFKKILENEFFQKTLIICLIPFVVFWMIVRYPNLFAKKTFVYFEKQINSALDYLRNER